MFINLACFVYTLSYLFAIPRCGTSMLAPVEPVEMFYRKLRKVVGALSSRLLVASMDRPVVDISMAYGGKVVRLFICRDSIHEVELSRHMNLELGHRKSYYKELLQLGYTPIVVSFNQGCGSKSPASASVARPATSIAPETSFDGFATCSSDR